MPEDGRTQTRPTVARTAALYEADSSWAQECEDDTEKAELRRGHRFESRYALRERLASGGTSTVYRAWDLLLERSIAVKLLNETTAQKHLSARFLAEARICARMSHPGILTVFDWGIRTDKRPYIAMPEIKGKTLRSHLRTLRKSGTDLLTPVVLRRLIGIVLSASEAMACAHSQCIIHRDIKPENIMIGAFGEVYVMDWGLGMIRGGTFPDLSREEPLPTLSDSDERFSTSGIGWQSHTTDGLVRGTMPYIPPEQAHGHNRALSERADVFMLGAILYEILSGHPPWGWASNRKALLNARAAHPLQLPPTLHIPDRIREICLQAVAIDPADRHPDAAALAHDLKAWLDRQDDAERAAALLQRAATAREEADQHEQAAAVLERHAKALLAGLPASAPEQDKHLAWDQLDEAWGLQRRAKLLQAERIQHLHNTLSFDPENHDAHIHLAEHYHQQHADAEGNQDTTTAEVLLLQLRRHNRGHFDRYLRPEGTLSLLTEPCSAQVRISVFQERHRRLVAVPLLSGLTTPITNLTLPIGSYIAELAAPGRHTTRLPFTIQRGQHTHGAFSPDDPPHPCWLPPAASAPEDMIYIPAGPLWSGGDALAYGAPLPLRRVWVEGLWIGRTHVTNARYLEFLNDLVAQGREEEALQHGPRGKTSIQGEDGPLCYGRDADGRFTLITDAEGHVWQPDWPVIMITFPAAQAYAAWKSAQTGLPLRLPWELEWEKAARGADRRSYVWGTKHFEPSWCRCRLSHERHPAPVGVHPVDVSVYGMADVVGNVSERCLDAFHKDGPSVETATGRWEPRVGLETHVMRGGSWGSHAIQSRLNSRGGLEDSQHPILTGFRLSLSL